MKPKTASCLNPVQLRLRPRGTNPFKHHVPPPPPPSQHLLPQATRPRPQLLPPQRGVLEYKAKIYLLYYIFYIINLFYFYIINLFYFYFLFYSPRSVGSLNTKSTTVSSAMAGSMSDSRYTLHTCRGGGVG